MARVGNLGGISKEDVAAGTRGGADGQRDASFLLDCLPQRLHADVGLFALSVDFTSGSITHGRARAFPPEQFACSKSAWVTRQSSRTDFVARTSAVKAEEPTTPPETPQEPATDPASVSVARPPRSTSTSSAAHPLS